MKNKFDQAVEQANASITQVREAVAMLVLLANYRSAESLIGGELAMDKDALMDALSACRDAFDTPAPGSALESLWGQAIGSPLAVPAHVKEQAAEIADLRAQLEAVGAGGASRRLLGGVEFMHACNLWVDPKTGKFVVDSCDHPASELVQAYISAAPLPPTEQPAKPIKDGEIAKVVNTLRDIAIEFHGAQQLRERIAQVVVPLLKAQPAGPDMQGVGNYPHEQMDALGLARYKLVQAADGYWPYAVVAGTGEQQIYRGLKSDCQQVVRILTSAFLDGGFAASELRPTTQLASFWEAYKTMFVAASEAPDVVLAQRLADFMASMDATQPQQSTPTLCVREDAEVSIDDELGLLKLAHDYAKWLDGHGRGSTFSTFVNEFPYDHMGANPVYTQVMAIISAAKQSTPVQQSAAMPPEVPRFQWTCDNGCGVCEPKRYEFVYERTETLDGELVSQKTTPQLVSKCCGVGMAMWDNLKDEQIDVVTSPMPINRAAINPTGGTT
jgi:hypothetical protein